MSEIVQNQYSSWQAENSAKFIYNGFIFVGQVDTDPEIEANRVRVYYIDENEQEINLTQPIHTNSSGFPVISETNSTVIQIRTDSDYSVKVLNSKGAKEWYIPKASRLSPVFVIEHNETLNRNDPNAHDGIYRRETTIAEISSGVFDVGSKLIVPELGGAEFNVVSGSVFDGFLTRSAGTNKIAKLQYSNPINFKHAGGIADTRSPTSGTLNDACLTAIEALNISIYFPEGSEIMGGSQRICNGYRFNQQHFIKESGVRWFGDDWATLIGTDNLSSGTIFYLDNPSDTPFLTIDKDDQTDIERITLEKIGFQGDKAKRCDVINYSRTRHYKFNYLYFTGVRDCINAGDTCWMGEVRRCQGFDYTRYGLRLNSASEDSFFSNLIFRGYGSNSVGLEVNAFSATNRFTVCDFSDNQQNVRVVANTGSQCLQYFDSCIFEATTGSGALGNSHTSIVLAGSPVHAKFSGCRGSGSGIQAGRSFFNISGGASVEFDKCSATGYPHIGTISAIDQAQRIVFNEFIGRGTTSDFNGPMLSIPYFESTDSFDGEYDLTGRKGLFKEYNLTTTATDLDLSFSGNGLYELNVIDNSGNNTNWLRASLTSRGTGGFASGNYKLLDEGTGNDTTVSFSDDTLSFTSIPDRSVRVLIKRLV